MSSDQKLPEPRSVWRRGDEFRCVTAVWRGFSEIAWAGFGAERYGSDQFAEWHAWADDAVQVWPETEKGTDE